MSEIHDLDLNEAVYVVGRSRAAINRDVDRGVIRATLQRRGKAVQRKIGPAELRYLAVANAVDLTPAGRKRVYEAIRELRGKETALRFGLLVIDLGDVDRRISERLADLAWVKSLVDDTAEKPVLRGTTAPVHAVAALARAQNVDEVRSEYPGLRDDQIAAATTYAEIYPQIGRPQPARSFKRALEDLAETGIWDLDEGEATPPQLIP